MITVPLNPHLSGQPLYMQLYVGIRTLILNGEIAAHEKLPSKRKLANHLKISVKTVENAYFQLVLEGYIYAREKSGYYASSIDGYYKKRTPRPKYVNRYKDHTYKVDIKANKTPTSMFPLSVWNRLGREAMADLGEHALETVPFCGVAELRVAIANHLQQFRGMSVSPDQVIVGSGTEFLYRRLLDLLGRESVIGMEDPGYAHIKKILDTSGTSLRSIPMDANGIRVNELAASDCSVVHVSPMQHFPLGITMPVQRRVDLLKWVNAVPGRYIIEDDYNCEFFYQGSPVPPLFSLDVRHKVIYMNTFSKTVSPGLRVAYMILPEELMDRYLTTMSFYSCTVPSVVQHQLARFISGEYLERYLHRVRQYNIAQRRLVQESIMESTLADRLRIMHSTAGTHFLVYLDTNVPDNVVLQGLAQNDIHASFVSEYCSGSKIALEHLLIVNYSSVTPEGMEYLLETLQKFI